MPDSKQESRRQVADGIADDLPYRIVEEMGLGLTFRSCACGQLPCARLRPLREALEAVRRDERERCAKAIAPLMEDHKHHCTNSVNAGALWIELDAAIRNGDTNA